MIISPEISPEQKKEIEQISRAHKLRFVILHGSYAKGTPRRGSDLDIAILGERRIAFDELLQIHGELGAVFGDNKEKELDLKTLQEADPLFRYYVVRDSRLLYGRRSDYEEFKSYAYRDYMDSYDLRNLEYLLLKKSIAALL